MPDFIIAYHGGREPASPEEGRKGMEKWKAWLTNLGDAVVNPGTPLGKSKMVTEAGVTDYSGPDSLTGFSIVKADNLDAALEIAKACPFVEMGTIEVAEVKSM
jgi:hypothetical protein